MSAAFAPATGAKTAREPIRVLHLRDSPWVDGPGRTILETAAHLDASRIEYHVGVFVATSDERHPLAAAVRDHGGAAHQIIDRGGFDQQTVRQIIELVDRLHIDVLHTSEFRSNLLGWMTRRRRKRLRWVSTVHGWIANTARRRVTRIIDKALLSRCDAAVIVSDATRALVPSWLVPNSRALVLRNALVLGKYGAAVLNAPRKCFEARGPIIIANIGRLSPEKDQNRLLRVFAELVAAHPSLDLRLWFAGTGPLENALREQAHATGLSERVRFLGFVEDMPALYQQIDLVVQSSFTEGLPNVILEAAYLRAPILATAVGGTAEVIEHARSGWLIPPRSDTALRAGIEAFLADPMRFTHMAAAAHERIVAEFSFDVRTRRLTEFYEKLMSRAA